MRIVEEGRIARPRTKRPRIIAKGAIIGVVVARTKCAYPEKCLIKAIA